MTHRLVAINRLANALIFNTWGTQVRIFFWFEKRTTVTYEFDRTYIIVKVCG
jgi:hypothetical protein